MAEVKEGFEFKNKMHVRPSTRIFEVCLKYIEKYPDIEILIKNPKNKDIKVESIFDLLASCLDGEDTPLDLELIVSGNYDEALIKKAHKDIKERLEEPPYV